MSEEEEETREKGGADSSANSAAEAEILQKIVTALGPLSKDARRRLIETVITFFGEEIAPSGQRFETSVSRPTFVPQFSEDRSTSAKEFLLEKAPQTDVERVACLAYYLTHYRDTPHFKTIDISKINTEAAQRKFSNAAKAVDNATTLGYLVPATKGQKQLSAAGELFVQALPDRAAAKDAMAKARPRKKSRNISKLSKKASD